MRIQRTQYQIDNKWMIVTKDNNDLLISVTDENGTPANTLNPLEVKLTDENHKLRHPIVYVSDDTFILTRSNPTCGWYWYGGQWYYICTG